MKDTMTAAMPRDMQPVSVETLTRAMREIELLPKPDQWIVVDPQGRMYKGTVEQVTRVLVQAHPLMLTPFELSGGLCRQTEETWERNCTE